MKGAVEVNVFLGHIYNIMLCGSRRCRSSHWDIPILRLFQYNPRKTGIHRAPPSPQRLHAEAAPHVSRRYPSRKNGRRRRTRLAGTAGDARPRTAPGRQRVRGNGEVFSLFRGLPIRGRPYTNFSTLISSPTHQR